MFSGNLKFTIDILYKLLPYITCKQSEVNLHIQPMFLTMKRLQPLCNSATKLNSCEINGNFVQ